MKNLILILAVFLLLSYSSNAQTWAWANSGGGPSGDYGRQICCDNDGNIYMSGSIMSSPVYFQTDTLITNGFNDCFIAKYNASGEEQWVIQFGGNNTYAQGEGVTGICFDTISNHLYLAGSFVTSCSFDSLHLTTGEGDKQILVAKFDANGHCLWAKSAGGPGRDVAGNPLITEDGSLMIAGDLEYGGYFESDYVPAGGFIARFDSLGNYLWGKKIFTNCSGEIALYNSDIFALYATNASTFTIDTLTITEPSIKWKFLARFDSVGTVKWVRVFGGPENLSWGNLVMDNFGNCYFPGMFSGSYALFGNDSLYSGGAKNYYLAKYDQNGNKKWLQQAIAPIDIFGEGMALDAGANLVVTGSFSDTVQFDTVQLIANGIEDAFVARYDSSGNYMNAIQVGMRASGKDIICDVNGSIIITGEFFDAIDFGITTLESNGSCDAWVAKLSSFALNIKEAEKTNKGLLIYANPTTGNCNIQVPDDFLYEDNLVLSIYNLNGQLIQQQSLVMNQEKVALNLEAEAKGVYTAVLSNGKKSYTGKIIFE